MKIQLTLTLILSLVFCNTYAQITFEKTIGGDSGEVGNSIIQTSDGGFFICGATESYGAGDFESYFVRTDSLGNILWTKSIGGPGSEICYDVKETFDGGFIAGGITNSFGAGLYDIFLIKMNANGDTIWTKTYGGADEEEFGSMSQTTEGGYILTGTTLSFGQSLEVYLLRLDSAGNVLWEKTYGGSSGDFGAKAYQTSDNGFIIAGETASFSSGIRDAYLIKTDGNGDLLWSKTYGGQDDDYVNDFQPTSDSGYIISGLTHNISTGSASIYLVRTDENGDTLWTHIYNTREKNYVYGIAQSAVGEFVVAGYAFDSTIIPAHACIMNFNLNGEPHWAKSFGGSKVEVIYGICPTLDGGFALTGISTSYDSINGKLYFIKTDANGNNFCNDATENIVSGNFPIAVLAPATIEATVTGIVGTPAFTISSGGIDSTLCSSIGIEEIVSGFEMNIFPNPATCMVTIMYSGIEAKKIGVFNLLGTKVIDVDPNNSSYEQIINLDHLQPGIYFISLYSESGIAVQKLIKQ